ncbi:MAG: type II secretion system protein [Verrucomicrobiota bacterium]
MKLPLLFSIKQHHPRRCRAFTLVEILLAFAIFGMVLLAIYACWTLILKSSKIGQDAAAQIQRERVAINTIKEALGGVVSYQSAPQYYTFLADNDENGHLSFAARLPEVFPRNGMMAFKGYEVRRVNFSVENGPDSQRQLVLRQTPLLREMHRDEEEFPFVVARGVNKLEMEFWDNRKNDWVDEWTRTNELPKMIKFKLEFHRTNPNQPYAQPVKEEILDIAALPAIMVPTTYQGPAQPGNQAPPPLTP